MGAVTPTELASPREAGNYGILRMPVRCTASPASRGVRCRTDAVVGNDFEPAWSPDGSRLVFERDQPTSSSIYTVNADGSHLTRLTTGPFFDIGPAYSPDGRPRH